MMNDSPGSPFVVSSLPIVPEEAKPALGGGNGMLKLGELPRSYGQPVLFVIARDPATLFVYWDIDWATAFGDARPADKKVYLRIYDANGIEENSVVVEPFAGQCYFTVQKSGASYRVELGYFQPDLNWNIVAHSELVLTPTEDLSAARSFEVASIPFHLGFQRMIDLLGMPNFDRGSLTELIAHLQKRSASSEEPLSLAPEESALLFALDSHIGLAASAAAVTLPTENWLEQKLEEFLGLQRDSATSLGITNREHRGVGGSSPS